MSNIILAAADPLDHVVQWAYQKVPVGTGDSFMTPGGEVTALSNHIIMQIIAVLLVLLVVPRAIRSPSTGNAIDDLTPRGFGNFIEAVCWYWRDHLVRPVLHEHTDRFIPFIWSVFFYVLFLNLLGLLPLEPLTRPVMRGIFPDTAHGFGGSATGNIWVTGTLACTTLLMIVINGLRFNGRAYLAHFFQGPVLIAPLIAVLEVIGLLAKSFALCVRLFANMVAGHVLLAVIFSFISVSYLALGAGPAMGISLLVVAGSVAFYCLEIFVACLQAFIFTFLTTLFIGQAVVLHHGEEHGEEHGEMITQAHS